MADLAELIELTRALVRIDSQNPTPGEAACADFVAGWLAQAGLPVRLLPLADGRPNLVARLEGRGGARPLVLLAHLDTVPIGEGWTIDPLGGEVRDGRLYGRGAADMKAGLAVALLLLRDLLREAAELRGDLLLCCTADEEGPGMAGAVHLVATGQIPRAALVLALEPTGLRLRRATVGVMWYQVVVQGRQAHGGRAPLGVDANHAMARIVVALKEAVAALPHRHPLLGPPLVTCSRLEGGVATNVVPPSCRAEFDLRIVPPMSPDDADALVRRVVAEAVAGVPGASAAVHNLGLRRPPVEAPETSPLVVALARAFARVVGRPLESGGADGHEAYTDASIVSVLTGNPHCTVWGPGSTDLAHVADEYVPVADLEVAARVLRALVGDLLEAPGANGEARRR